MRYCTFRCYSILWQCDIGFRNVNERIVIQLFVGLCMNWRVIQPISAIHGLYTCMHAIEINRAEYWWASQSRRCSRAQDRSCGLCMCICVCVFVVVVVVVVVMLGSSLWGRKWSSFLPHRKSLWGRKWASWSPCGAGNDHLFCPTASPCGASPYS